MRATAALFVPLVVLLRTPACGAPAPAVGESVGASSSPSPSADPAPTANDRNLLRNPGFEAGRDPWSRMPGANWGDFEVVEAGARSGRAAARLLVEPTPAESGAKVKVFGVLQEIRGNQMPGGFPETLSGWYRVNRWERGDPATDMYLQVVVIVWGDPRTVELVYGKSPGGQAISNYQIRFYLGGLTEPPFTLSNARLRFVEKGDPLVGEWVHFSIPVRKAFQESWGVVPADFEFLRVLFEARWDNRPPGTPLAVDVVYDDLFFGYGDP